MNDEKIASFTTIILLLLKGERIRVGMHQAMMGERCHRTPSAWGKIESGKTTLTMDIVCRACEALNVKMSDLMIRAEECENYLTERGWHVGYVDEESSDLLLKLGKEYFDSKGVKSRPRMYMDYSDVFRFSTDEEFKEEMLNYSIL